jgi:hypothetical protein
VAAYQRATAVPRNTATVLATVSRDIGDTALERSNYQWAGAWVRGQKLEQHRSPGTIPLSDDAKTGTDTL